MLRYVACIWDKESLSQRQEALTIQRRMLSQPRWCSLFDAPGLAVLGTGVDGKCSKAHQLSEQGGVILGSFFQRSDNMEQRQVTLPVASKILESRGHYLAENYHGEYIAFVRDAAGRRCLVAQGPSAGRPAYRTGVAGLFLYFSELADVMRSASLNLEIDWDYVASHMISPIRQGRATAIRSIGAMEGGDCDEVSSGRLVTNSFWSPVTFALQRFDDIEECVRQTRARLKQSVNAWASCHENAVLSLSGGLDSSILAVCWANAPARSKITSATFYGLDPSGDERASARIAAKAAQCQLMELALQARSDLDTWSTAAPSPRPVFFATMAQQKQMIELAHEFGASAIVTGDGGDAAFYEPADIRIAADYVRDHGLGPSAAGVIMATAMLTDRSVWSVVRAASQGLAWRRRQNVNIIVEAAKFRKLVSASGRKSFSENVDRYAPSYVQDAMALPAAKFSHIWMVSQPIACRSALGAWDDPMYVNPYADEVVKEFCLATPTYIHCREGWTRWLPRIAFAGEVPAEILERATKGRPDAYFHSFADEHLRRLRERVLDGQLVKRGILDHSTVERSSKGQTVQGNAPELLDAYGLEVWLDIINGASQQAMAA